MDTWPSRTSARNPVPPGLLAGVDCGLGCLASFALPSLHPSLGAYSPPGSPQSACPVSQGQRTPHVWEALLPAAFSHLLPSTSFHSTGLPYTLTQTS